MINRIIKVVYLRKFISYYTSNYFRRGDGKPNKSDIYKFQMIN